MTGSVVLALDCCFGPVSAALKRPSDGTFLHRTINGVPGRQAETMPPMVSDLFAEAGLNPSELGRVIVTSGPGAFTGVRVGLSFALGLKIALNCEVIGVGTLECLAVQAGAGHPNEPYLAGVIDAKRDEVYLQVFTRDMKPVTSAMMLPVPEISSTVSRAVKDAPIVLAGSGAKIAAQHVKHSVTSDVAQIDILALIKRGCGLDATLYPPVPCYLREPDAKLPAA